MIWTDERIELLKKLHADGLSASQIASQLGGVTRNSVIGKLDRLRGRAKPSSPAPYRPSSPVTLLDLNDQTCRWPIDPGYFCGDPSLDGYPYCGPHCRRAYRAAA